MYYQLAQLSYSGLLLLLQIFFLCIIRRRNQIKSQVFQEPQQVKQSELHTQKDIQMKSSIMLSSKIRKSDQYVRHSILKAEVKEDHPVFAMASNSSAQYLDAMNKEQKYQKDKVESPNSTILQIHSTKIKSQIENPESQRDPLEKLIGEQSIQQDKTDMMIQLVYYVERIGFEQGLILLLWNFDLKFYIFIPMSLLTGVLLRLQEQIGYRMIQMIVLIVIHGFLILEIYLIKTNEYETICYLIVFGFETIFSVISIILHKKCH
ncbi:unnamed protein product [Paramecium pentaurelia]|uniref:Transmembrane protein n=1 Tax=Paramecium pentaurelia TaxID=43138 RepID=A0A8S1W8Z2_9CILI|nr:unnamed protein product [Paramecium pentaurelia]